MSDIHAWIGDPGGNFWQLVCHIPIPNVSNDVGANYRTALVNSGLGVQPDGRRTILEQGTGPGQIAAAEEAELDAGELFEVVAIMPIPPGATPQQLSQIANDIYAQVRTETVGTLQNQLRYFGFTKE